MNRKWYQREELCRTSFDFLWQDKVSSESKMSCGVKTPQNLYYICKKTDLFINIKVFILAYI